MEIAQNRRSIVVDHTCRIKWDIAYALWVGLERGLVQFLVDCMGSWRPSITA